MNKTRDNNSRFLIFDVDKGSVWQVLEKIKWISQVLAGCKVNWIPEAN